MKRKVLVSPIAKRVSFVIHLRKLAGCGNDNSMIDKEFDRYESLPGDLLIEGNTGDPGR